jgi:PAS domain S-box-containing protein
MASLPDARFRALSSLVLSPATALEGLREGVVLSDPRLPDNPVVFANSSFLEMTGYEEHEILGRNCRFLQGAMTDAQSVAKIRAALAVPEPVTVELLNYRKNGEPFWNRLTISPVRDESGNPSYFIAIQRDVTAQHEIPHELEHKDPSVLALREANKLLMRRIQEQEDLIASYIMQR